MKDTHDLDGLNCIPFIIEPTRQSHIDSVHMDLEHREQCHHLINIDGAHAHQDLGHLIVKT